VVGAIIDRRKMSRADDKRLQPIWGQLAKELGVQELPTPVKDLLLTHHEPAINAALGTGEQEDFEPLIPVAKGLYSSYGLRGSKRRRRKRNLDKGSEIITPEVGQYERLRASVLSEYLAKIVSIDPEVVQFRNAVLATELLTPVQARAFLSSPASRYLSLEVWRAYGIPARHTAALLGENYGHTEDGPFHWVQVRTEPPGETHAVFIPNPQSYENVTYLAGNGRPKRVTVWPGSVLGNLRNLCKELTKAHPWDVYEAIWFVLTGEIPLVRPIRAKTHSSSVLGGRAYNTISLTVQPWVSPETVEMAYRQLQKRVIGGGSGRIAEKSLNLLRFVTKRADGNGNLPKGYVLVADWDRQWKEKRPQWCYGSDTRRFWRDFRNVQESVTNSRRAGIFLESGQYMPEQTVQEKT
jgi:hypothetical protein